MVKKNIYSWADDRLSQFWKIPDWIVKDWFEMDGLKTFLHLYLLWRKGSNNVKNSANYFDFSVQYLIAGSKFFIITNIFEWIALNWSRLGFGIVETIKLAPKIRRITIKINQKNRVKTEIIFYWYLRYNQNHP